MNLDSPTHNSDNDQDEARSDKETDGENDMNEGEVNQSTKKVTLEDEVEKELWSPPHVWINTSEIPNGDVSFLVGLNSPSCNEQEGVPKHYTGENLTLQTITAAMEKAGEHISKEIELRGALVEIFHKREKADSEEKDDENISASDKEDEKEEVDEGHDSGSEHSTSKAKRKEQKVINLTLLRVSAGGCYTNITLISAHPRVHIFVYPGHYREPNGQLVIDTQVLKPRKDHKESDNTMNISGSILIRGLSELDVHNKALKLSQIKSRQKKTGSKRSPTMNNTYVFRQDALNEHSTSDNALYALCKRRAIVPLINGDVASQRILEERHRRLFFPTIEGIVEILGPTSCYYDHGDRHATPTMSLSGRKHGQGNVQQFEEDTPRDDQNHAAEEISHPAENLVSHENLSEKEINNKEMLYSINQVQRNYQSSPITIEHLNLVGGVRFRAQSVAEITQCSIMCLDQISSQYGLWPGASDEMDELDPSKNTNNVSMDSLKQSSPPGTNLPEVCVAIHAHAKPLLRNCCITTRHDARLAAWYDPWLFGDREIENKPFYNCDSLDKEKLLRRIQHANDRFYFHHHSGVANCENHPNQVRIGLYVYPLARGLVQGCLIRCWNAAPVIFHEKLHGLNEDAPPPPPFLRALFNSAQGGSTDLKTPDNILDIGAVLHGESTTLFRHSIFSGGDVNLYVLSNEDHLLHNHIESKLIEMYRTFRSKMNENDNPDDEDVDKEDGTSSPQRKRDSKYIALLRRDTVKQLGCSFQRCDFLSARVMTVRIVGRRRSQTPLSCTNCVFAPLNIPWCAQVWAKSFLAILPPGLSVRNQKNNSAKEVTLNLVTSKSALLRTHMMNMPSPLLLNDDKNEEQRRRMPYAIHCTAGGSMTLRGCVIHRGVVYFDTTCLVRESRFSNDDNPFHSTYGNVTCLENILTATSHVSSTCEKTSSLKNGFSERDDVLSLPRAKEIPRSVPVEIGYPLLPSFLLAKRFREEGGFESDKKRDEDSTEKEDTDDIPRTISSLEILQRGYMLLGDTLVSQNTTVQNGLSDIRPTDNEPYTDSFVWGVLAPSISKQVAKESNVESEE